MGSAVHHWQVKEGGLGLSCDATLLKVEFHTAGDSWIGSISSLVRMQLAVHAFKDQDAL